MPWAFIEVYKRQSLPFVVGAAGLKRAIIPPLTDGEKAMLHKSADALKEVISQLNI